MSEFKVGDSFRVKFPYYWESKKIHIMYILDGYYDDEKLVVIRYFGKRKQWWHEELFKLKDIERFIGYYKTMKTIEGARV